MCKSTFLSFIINWELEVSVCYFRNCLASQPVCLSWYLLFTLSLFLLSKMPLYLQQPIMLLHLSTKNVCIHTCTHYLEANKETILDFGAFFLSLLMWQALTLNLQGICYFLFLFFSKFSKYNMKYKNKLHFCCCSLKNLKHWLVINFEVSLSP